MKPVAPPPQPAGAADPAGLPRALLAPLLRRDAHASWARAYLLRDRDPRSDATALAAQARTPGEVVVAAAMLRSCPASGTAAAEPPHHRCSDDFGDIAAAGASAPLSVLLVPARQSARCTAGVCVARAERVAIGRFFHDHDADAFVAVVDLAEGRALVVSACVEQDVVPTYAAPVSMVPDGLTPSGGSGGGEKVAGSKTRTTWAVVQAAAIQNIGEILANDDENDDNDGRRCGGSPARPQAAAPRQQQQQQTKHVSSDNRIREQRACALLEDSFIHVEDIAFNAMSPPAARPCGCMRVESNYPTAGTAAEDRSRRGGRHDAISGRGDFPVAQSRLADCTPSCPSALAALVARLLAPAVGQGCRWSLVPDGQVPARQFATAMFAAETADLVIGDPIHASSLRHAAVQRWMRVEHHLAKSGCPATNAAHSESTPNRSEESLPGIVALRVNSATGGEDPSSHGSEIPNPDNVKKTCAGPLPSPVSNPAQSGALLALSEACHFASAIEPASMALDREREVDMLIRARMSIQGLDHSPRPRSNSVRAQPDSTPPPLVTAGSSYSSAFAKFSAPDNSVAGAQLAVRPLHCFSMVNNPVGQIDVPPNTFKGSRDVNGSPRNRPPRYQNSCSQRSRSSFEIHGQEMSVSQDHSQRSAPSRPPLLPNIASLSRNELRADRMLPPLSFPTSSPSRSRFLSYLEAGDERSARGDVGGVGSRLSPSLPALSRRDAPVTADSPPLANTLHASALENSHSLYSAEQSHEHQRPRRRRTTTAVGMEVVEGRVEDDGVHSATHSSAFYSNGSVRSIVSPGDRAGPAPVPSIRPTGMANSCARDGISLGQAPPHVMLAASDNCGAPGHAGSNMPCTTNGFHPVLYPERAGVPNMREDRGYLPHHLASGESIGACGYGSQYGGFPGGHGASLPAPSDMHRGQPGPGSGPYAVQYSVGSSLSGASPMRDSTRSSFGPMPFYGTTVSRVPVPAGGGHPPGGPSRDNAMVLAAGSGATIVEHAGLHGDGISGSTGHGATALVSGASGAGGPAGEYCAAASAATGPPPPPPTVSAVSLGSRPSVGVRGDVVELLTHAATADELRAAKRMLRKVKNREAAARSNLRRKIRDDALKADVASIRERVHVLRGRAESLRAENGRMRAMLRTEQARQARQARQVQSQRAPAPARCVPIVPSIGKPL